MDQTSGTKEQLKLIMIKRLRAMFSNIERIPRRRKGGHNFIIIASSIPFMKRIA